MTEDMPLSSVRRELDALASLRDELEQKAPGASAELRGELRALAHKLALVDALLERVHIHVIRDLMLMRRELNTLVRDLRQRFEAIRRALDN